VISITCKEFPNIYTMYVHNIRQAVYLLMALAVLSAPLLACTLPGVAMSEEEQECCRHMADQCGSSQMEESHACCTKTPTLSAGTLQPTVKFSPAALDLVIDIAPSPIQPGTGGILVSTARVLESSESPPGYISVLRI
jgi:hypothetical protein